MDIKKQIGDAVRHFRLAAGLNQTDFGDDNSSMSRLERGEQGVRLDKLPRIAARMNVKVSDIWLYAERLAAPEASKAKPLKAVDLRFKSDLKDSAAAGNFRVYTAAFVENVISTTPDAVPALQELLQKLLASRTSDGDRAILERLIGRAASAKARKTKKDA